MIKMEKGQPASSPKGAKTISGDLRSNRAILLMATLDMSWRLAIVVLVPIIGGFEIDKHLGSSPALTIIGFLLAMAGLFVIIRQTVRKADEKFRAGTK